MGHIQNIALGTAAIGLNENNYVGIKNY